MTYYLQGKAGKTCPPTVSISPIGGAFMETVNEEDEPHDSPTSHSEGKPVIECSETINDGAHHHLETDMACGESLMKKEVEPKDSTEATLLLSQVDT
ncbi:hypothetical protein JTB14_021738 [Gonioctena quinquepunctata]|nr:hypothetical protein JTB14_021738 [Gonioctena quinquepunctata]